MTVVDPMSSPSDSCIDRSWCPWISATTTLRGVIADVTALIGRYQDEGILQPEPTATLIPALFGPIVLPVITRDFAIIDQGDPSDFDPARHVARFLHGRAEPTR